jgi:hypothetical protein
MELRSISSINIEPNYVYGKSARIKFAKKTSKNEMDVIKDIANQELRKQAETVRDNRDEKARRPIRKVDNENDNKFDLQQEKINNNNKRKAYELNSDPNAFPTLGEFLENMKKRKIEKEKNEIEAKSKEKSTASRVLNFDSTEEADIFKFKI